MQVQALASLDAAEPVLLRITSRAPSVGADPAGHRHRPQPVPVRRHARDLPRAVAARPAGRRARRGADRPGHRRVGRTARLRGGSVGRPQNWPADTAAVVVASHGHDEAAVLARGGAVGCAVHRAGRVAPARCSGARRPSTSATRTGPASTRRRGSTSARARPRRWRCRSWPRSCSCRPPAASSPPATASAGDGRRPGVRHDRSRPSIAATSTTTASAISSAGRAAEQAFVADPGDVRLAGDRP